MHQISWPLLVTSLLILSMGCSDGDKDELPPAQQVLSAQIWQDPDTGLTWQRLGKDADKTDFRGIIPSEAYTYCAALEQGGFDDWRMPTYAELITLVAGNPATQPGGECQVGVTGAGTAEGKTAACASTGSGGDYGGPGLGGCYWKDGLAGPCNNIDPFGTHPYETLAADVANDKPDEWISYVTFATGAAGYNHACSLAEVRCVRSEGPEPTCEIAGKPCHEYYRSKTYCDQDFTGQADSLRVTVTLPKDAVIETPYQLVGFLYDADADWFPPIGPPAGGTDYNQVFLSVEGAPRLDANTPLVMNIPATTYYREALLSGDYQLFFELQIENIFPPIPVDGDYVYGQGRSSISFPLNGTAHTGQVLELSVELELVGCPLSSPVACRDGSCALEESACEMTSVCPESSSCFPNCPSDAEILSCIYENAFDGGALAVVDYPESEGWTAETAVANCAVIIGANSPRVVQGEGQSNLVQVGGSGLGRCVFTADGQRSFAQDIGATFCTLGGGIWEATGPYCAAY